MRPENSNHPKHGYDPGPGLQTVTTASETKSADAALDRPHRFFSWRLAILRSDLQPVTRHVLLTLSCHMNDAGESCFPSLKTLCRETGLSNRCVIDHLRIAADAGWINISSQRFRGQAWKRNSYSIQWPEGGEPRSPRPAEGGEPRSPEVVSHVHTSTSLNSSRAENENCAQLKKPTERVESLLDLAEEHVKKSTWNFLRIEPDWDAKDFAPLAEILKQHPNVTIEEVKGRFDEFLCDRDILAYDPEDYPSLFWSRFDRYSDWNVAYDDNDMPIIRESSHETSS